MDGMLYYRIYQSLWGGQVWPGVVCVDLRTGQKLWENDNAYIDVAQEWNIEYPTGKGVIPFLWSTSGTTWNVYDPFTGKLMFNFTNAIAEGVMSGTYPIVFTNDGTMLVYVLDGLDGWFAMWNSTKCFLGNGLIWCYPPSETPPVWEYAPGAPGTYDWSKGIQWNVTIPMHLMNSSVGVVYPVYVGFSGDVLVAQVGSINTGGLQSFMDVGYSLTTGQ
jgi:hypothetical protein